MNVKSAIWSAAIIWQLTHFATFAVAQPVERVSGSWFENDGKVGLVLQKGDAHPYFLYGECDKSRREARIQVDIDPRLFGDAVAKELYIIFQWGDGTSKVMSYVDGISLMEMGRYTWSPFVKINREMVNFWQRASRLDVTVGVREKDVFRARQTYVLPDEGRRAVLTSFSRSCLGSM